MPELPDVESFRSYLERTALHQPIAHTSVPDQRILEGVTIQKLAVRLKNREFVSTDRHGKFLFVRVARDGWLVFHFGMTGELSYFKSSQIPPYMRLLLSFTNGYNLAYQSRRLLGQVSFTNDSEQFIEEHDLGPDALDEALRPEKFLRRLSGRKGKIKPILTNQSIIAGIGNLYADEILFQSGIHPETPASRLEEDELKHLYEVMRRVLNVAVKNRARVDAFPKGYLLKQREDAVCPRCGGRLEKRSVAGRTSRVCEQCQPLRK